ncbi:MAG: hypothetical protein ACOX0N_11770 [Syntrophomonadaceae bacterium]|nr:hypothetical protein [Syntrophomonadaceae bacterium]
MSRSLSYKNVSKRRFNCMKSTMRARVHDFARKNNYRITVWQVPDKDSGRWHIKLESSKINKPSLDFIANVKRSPNNLLTIDLIHMPAFISTSSAVREVNAVYHSCSE